MSRTPDRVFAHAGSYYAAWTVLIALVGIAVWGIAYLSIASEQDFRQRQQECLSRGGQMVPIDKKTLCGHITIEFTPR